MKDDRLGHQAAEALQEGIDFLRGRALLDQFLHAATEVLRILAAQKDFAAQLLVHDLVATGGPPIVICDAPTGSDGSWSEKDGVRVVPGGSAVRRGGRDFGTVDGGPQATIKSVSHGETTCGVTRPRTSHQSIRPSMTPT